jgi:hypothetical protein
MTDDTPAPAAAEAPEASAPEAAEAPDTAAEAATAAPEAATVTAAPTPTPKAAEGSPAKPRRNVKQRGATTPPATPAPEVPAPPAAPPTAGADADADADAGAGGRDIWRRVGAVTIVLVAAFAVVVLWARPAHEPAPPVAQHSSAPPAVTVLNPTDIAYLQLMISLDASAVQLFELIIASGDPVLGPIARTAAEGHQAELAALRKALSDGGAVEDSSIHAGHDLPGMVVEADMAAIRAVPAAQQPAKALEVLRDHLTGTTALCGSEAKNGADPATKAAAEAVLAAHGKLLAQLPTV